jgi:hypothetical protein
MVTFILTRIQVGDYDRWKPQFDRDRPGAREEAESYRVFRNAEDPNEVFILIEFESEEDARRARERLLASGVLDRFDDKTGPTIIDLADSVTR